MLRQRIGGLTSSSNYLHQERLQKVIKELFPEYDIKYNVRKALQLVSPVTRSYLELDVWLPALNLAFEFQDPHHYISTWYENAPLNDIKFNDSIKIKEAEKLGITLVTIPCWWDGSITSLVGTIKRHKSTLLPNFDGLLEPISPVPPAGFLAEPQIEGVGHPMLVSFPESAQVDPTNWWMGEKFDGVRAIWSPKPKILHSRYARKLAIPESVSKWFSPVFLDTEIWFGRGTFASAQDVVKGLASDWAGMRAIGLDYPGHDKHDWQYEDRYAHIVQSVPSTNAIVILEGCRQCFGKLNLQKTLHLVLEAGGEGVVIRKCKSKYQQGRSDAILKLKAARDQEGVVMEVKDNTYYLQLRDRKIISAKAPKTHSPVLRVGDVATVSYYGLNQYVILRKRDDVYWPDHIRHPVTENKLAAKMFSKSSARPRGYWTMDGNKNIRRFLDNVAFARGLDPLLPSTWYDIPLSDLAFQRRGQAWPLYHYSSSRVKAIMDNYPNIGLDESMFASARKKWNVQRNRKLFFDKFAEKHGFIAQIPENWYSIEKGLILKQRGGLAILRRFDSIAAALADAYPILQFDTSKFITPRRQQRTISRARSNLR